MPPHAADEYKPTSRRPIAALFRATAHGAVRFCVARGIHPDTVSWASVAVSALAGLAFIQAGAHPWLLLAAPLLCHVRLWFNMLDGMVALASGKASRRGEILNELPDRASDLLVFAGLAHSGLVNPFLAYWAAIVALLTAYVGTFGQAVAGRREYGGVMSKPWRMAVVTLGAWGTWAWPQRGPVILGSACLLVIVGGFQTVWVRLASTLRRLEAP
jgi:phosphatidylglycerophosphate synthase